MFLASWHGVVQQQPSSPLGPLSPRTGLLLKDDIFVKLIQDSSGAEKDRGRLCRLHLTMTGEFRI